MMQKEEHFVDKLAYEIQHDNNLDDVTKSEALQKLSVLRQTKVHILITGATGCGKSSTINALFGKNVAKVGQGVNPETMDIAKFDLTNIVLYDSPGLGDGKDSDLQHAKNIVTKLYEKNEKDELLIDLVLVILDGSTRDLGTSSQLINEVILPNIGDNKNRLLVAINQADMAMKRNGWNKKNNSPEPALEKFLGEKVISTKNRIKEATGVDIEPIYYSAGYKEGNKEQNPYNLSKLMYFILQHTQKEKRAVLLQDMNEDNRMWKDDDRLINYRKGILDTISDAVADVLGGVANTVKSAWKSVCSFFGGSWW